MDVACDNCLCHLEVCQAECCREFSVTLTKNLRVYKGLVLSWKTQDEDMKNYYRLHGLFVKGDVVTVKLSEFKKDGTNLTIYSKCQALTETNLCSLHNTSQQPRICEYPNKTGTGGKVYLTPNCVYKKGVIGNNQYAIGPPPYIDPKILKIKKVKE